MRKGLTPVRKKRYFVILAIFIIIFLAIKIPNMSFNFSDENTYFYMGKLILDGYVPYRDFFHANPPVQIYLIGLVMSLVGKHLILLKLIPIAASVTSSLMIFGIVKRYLGEKEGLLASVLYLFSFVVLTTTDHSTGVHLSVMFILASIYFLNKPLVAGCFAGLAVMTRLYTPFLVAGMLLYLYFYEKEKIWRFILGMTIVASVIAIFFIILSKGDIISQILGFRMNLVELAGIPKLRILKFFLRWDLVLVLGTIGFLFTRNKERLALFSIMGVFLLLFYYFYSDLYYLYLGLIAPLLAVFAVYTIRQVTRSVKSRYFNLAIALFIIFIVSFNSFYYLKDHAKTAKIAFIDDITEFVKETTQPKDTIYGSFEIAPIVALRSGRDITNRFVDTNDKNFMTGVFSKKEMTEQMTDIKYIIAKVVIIDKKILSIGHFADLDFLDTCSIVKAYPIDNDYSSNAVLVFDC